MALEGGRTLRIASSARGGATWLGRRLCWPLSHRPVSGGASQVGLPARVPGAGLGLGYGMGLQPPRRRVAERLPGRAMAWGRRAVDRSRVTAVARWRRMFCARRSHSRGGWVGAIEWRPGLCLWRRRRGRGARRRRPAALSRHHVHVIGPAARRLRGRTERALSKSCGSRASGARKRAGQQGRSRP